MTFYPIFNKACFSYVVGIGFHNIPLFIKWRQKYTLYRFFLRLINCKGIFMSWMPLHYICSQMLQEKCKLLLMCCFFVMSLTEWVKRVKAEKKSLFISIFVEVDVLFQPSSLRTSHGQIQKVREGRRNENTRLFHSVFSHVKPPMPLKGVKNHTHTHTHYMRRLIWSSFAWNHFTGLLWIQRWYFWWVEPWSQRS